jgi:DNA invertase Pin-like site-specific DNA recombinase
MRYVAYYRVSTEKQGHSGLGLDAQRQAVQQYSASIDSEFIEIESGSDDTRPQLLAALAQCQKTGATILIAKLDRLSRDASFLFQLRKSGVEILAADMPNAGMLEFGIRAIFAQHEREQISARTKAALAQAKLRGVRLGCPCPGVGAAASALKKAKKANDYASALKPLLESLTNRCASYQDLADALTLKGIRTASGNIRWGKSSAHAVMQRLGLSL